jgi:hypothetical protein
MRAAAKRRKQGQAGPADGRERRSLRSLSARLMAARRYGRSADSLVIERLASGLVRRDIFGSAVDKCSTGLRVEGDWW